MRSVEGMSIVVTGGGSGIGEAAARHFVRLGARVTICGRRHHKVEAVAASLGPACRAICADVTIEADRLRLIEGAVGHGGGIDVLINNAGDMYRGPIETLDEQLLLNVFHTNVIGPMLLTGAAVDLLEARRGCVMFIGSVHTQRAFPGASPYAATKGALETLTAVLAAELGPRLIRVGCVRPGAVFTELNVRAGVSDTATARARVEDLASAHALGRIGTGDEVAEALEYLARSEWATGSVLTIDGGLGLGVTLA